VAKSDNVNREKCPTMFSQASSHVKILKFSSVSGTDLPEKTSQNLVAVEISRHIERNVYVGGLTLLYTVKCLVK
jgi:hypothetical protein